MIAPASPTDQELQREFRALLPELSSRLRCRFYEHGRDLAAEYVAEATAMSWDTYRSARRRDKRPTAGNLAWYTAKAVLRGRRFAGSSSTDVMSPKAQNTIGKTVSVDAGQGLYDLIIDKRWRYPVVQVVGTRLDWDAFVATCRERDQTILHMQIQGYWHKDIASAIGVSSPAVTQRLAKLKRDWMQYSGVQA